MLLLLYTITDNWELTTCKSVVLQNWPLESISLALCCWRKYTETPTDSYTSRTFIQNIVQV